MASPSVTSGPTTSVGTNMTPAPQQQAIAFPAYSQPSIGGGPRQPRKQNIKLPSVQTVFYDLGDIQWFSNSLRV